MTTYSHHIFIDVFRLTSWLVILSVIFIPLERLWPVRRQDMLRREVWVDLTYYFINSLIVGLFLSVPLAFAVEWSRAIIPHGFYAAVASAPTWVRVLAAFLVAEIGFYWGHRLSHEIPFLWRFHSVHHSAENMDFLVNTRGHIFDILFVRLCGFVPLYALGLADPFSGNGAVLPLLVGFVGVLWGFFIHANVRWNLGPLKYVLATPLYHHWHHTLDGPIDRNYASTFPPLDIVFGTLHLPRQWPSAYGIPAATPGSIWGQFLKPFGLFATSESSHAASEMESRGGSD